VVEVVSILDQIIDVERFGQEVQVRSLQARDWLPAASSFAMHQAIEDGFDPIDPAISPRLVAPIGQQGVVSVAAALKAVTDVERILIKDQATPLQFRETANDFQDGRIKPGSKLIIRMIRAGSIRGSWSQIARDVLVTDGPSAITFDKFSTQSITVPDEERYQIVETFGGNVIYGFGRRPQFLRISGQVVNGSMDVIVKGERRSHDWANKLLRDYERHFRLTALIRNSMRLVIFCQDTIYTGFLLNLTPMVTEDTQNMMSVSLSMVLSDRTWSRNEDSSIAGTLSKDGLYLPGGATPEQYFSKADVSAYFQQGYKSVLARQRVQLTKDVSEVVRQIMELQGIALTSANVKGAVDAVQTYYEQNKSSFQERYWEDMLGLRAHKLLRVGVFRYNEALLFLATKERDIEKEKFDWITTHNRGGQFELPQGASAQARVSYLAISAKEGALGVAKRGFAQTTQELNRLCDRLLLRVEQLAKVPS
jgi:hypothetical protein